MMKIVHKENRLCTCCMEKHEVKTVVTKTISEFKGLNVEYEATSFYCDKAEEFYEDETLLRTNDIAMKDAYRLKQGLLTSSQIQGIRAKYGITQNDLCTLLGWGGKTITRYESYQVQDKAHDSILKKLEQDPEWFLKLLEEAKNSLSPNAYQKYHELAVALYEKAQDNYLRKTIIARYAKFQKNAEYYGNTMLSLDKVIDVIRYFAASTEVTVLYKVKLMKMLWFSDMLSYRKRNFGITGLVYKALAMGAVPVEHNLIIELQGIPCEKIERDETSAYHFVLKGENTYPYLSEDDKDILDVVIEKCGKMSKDEIVAFMHQEPAYTETSRFAIISYEYAKFLQI